MSVYGSPLWEFDINCIDRFYVAWRKGIRRLPGLPYNTYCELLNLICDDLPTDNQIDGRTCKCLASCKASDHVLTQLFYNLAHDGSQSTACNNISFICSKYGLIRYNCTECVMECRGSDLSNCIRADVIRDMINVVEFGRHDSRPTADLNVHEAQELMHDLCSN